MKLPPPSRYPKSLLVKDEEYKIKIDPKLGIDTAGECDPSDRVIRLNKNLSSGEAFSTLIHELLHAIEFEYDLKISHKLVHQLEHAITNLLLNNL